MLICKDLVLLRIYLHMPSFIDSRETLINKTVIFFFFGSQPLWDVGLITLKTYNSDSS